MLNVGTKVLLNTSLRCFVKVFKQGDRACRIMCLHTDSEAPPTQQAFVIRTKTSQETEQLFALLEEQIKAAVDAGY